eukprot:TCALIF_08730-PA protein Name:"Protein of unknown function" AED:0.52 eAED:0.52 QI:0/0/0/0.5/1/1/2/0/394
MYGDCYPPVVTTRTFPNGTYWAGPGFDFMQGLTHWFPNVTVVSDYQPNYTTSLAGLACLKDDYADIIPEYYSVHIITSKHLKISGDLLAHAFDRTSWALFGSTFVFLMFFLVLSQRRNTINRILQDVFEGLGNTLGQGITSAEQCPAQHATVCLLSIFILSNTIFGLMFSSVIMSQLSARLPGKRLDTWKDLQHSASQVLIRENSFVHENLFQEPYNLSPEQTLLFADTAIVEEGILDKVQTENNPLNVLVEGDMTFFSKYLPPSNYSREDFQFSIHPLFVSPKSLPIRKGFPQFKLVTRSIMLWDQFGLLGRESDSSKEGYFYPEPYLTSCDLPPEIPKRRHGQGPSSTAALSLEHFSGMFYLYFWGMLTAIGVFITELLGERYAVMASFPRL